MASASVPGMHGWGNLYHSSGALRPSPSHRGGLRAPFLCSCRVANIADHMRQRAFRSLSILILDRKFRLRKEVVLHEGVSHKGPAYDTSEVSRRGN
jgi:hypothetical protein